MKVKLKLQGKLNEVSRELLGAIGISIKEGETYEGVVISSAGEELLISLDSKVEHPFNGRNIMLTVIAGGECLYLEKGSRWVVVESNDHEYVEPIQVVTSIPISLN